MILFRGFFILCGLVVLLDLAVRLSLVADPMSRHMIDMACRVVWPILGALLILFGVYAREGSNRVVSESEPAPTQGTADSVSANPPQVQSRSYSWLWGVPMLAVVVAVIVGLVFGQQDQERQRKSFVWDETFTVRKGEVDPHVIPLRRGDLLWLKVGVIEGAPVDVRVGTKFRREGNIVNISDAGVLQGRKVREFTLDWEPWEHEEKAILMISSDAESRVKAEARIR